jgi:hypothetical protein
MVGNMEMTLKSKASTLTPKRPDAAAEIIEAISIRIYLEFTEE